MKKLAKGFTLVELLVVIAIIGVLSAALIPNVAGAIQSSNMTACMANGRSLFQAMMTRESQDAGSIYPKTYSSGESTEGEAQIRDTAFSTGYDYFNMLFDVENSSNADQWSPAIDCDMKLIWGFGVSQGRAGQKLKKDNILWCMGANITDSVPAFVPVLVSRNANVKDMTTKYTGSGSTKIGIGKTNGSDYDTPFGSKGFVYITKGGAGVKVDNKLDARYDKIYSQAFDLSDTEEGADPFQYLTPDGKATLK